MKISLLKIKIWAYIFILKNLKGYAKVSTKLLYAQAWHETGDFKSQVYKENNNLFGMRHPSVRKTRSTGSKYAHAVFKNHYDSVLDYFLRQKYFKIPDSDDQEYMVNTVNSGYAEDKVYLAKWQNVKDKISKPFTTWFFVGLLFFFVLIGLLILKTRK